MTFYGKAKLAQSTAPDGTPTFRYDAYDVPYRKFDSKGNLISTGVYRMPSKFYLELEVRRVYVWDGLTRTKSGRRRFKYIEQIIIKRKDFMEVKAYYKNKYSVEVVELR